MSTDRRAHTRFAAALLTFAVALVALVALVAACGTGNEEQTGEPAEPPTADETTAEPAVEAASEEPAEEPEEDPSSGDDADGIEDDWQQADFGGGSFFVPPTWEVETYEAGGEESERAVYGRGHCGHDERLATGLAFVTWSEGETDAAAAAVEEVERAVDSFYGDRSPEVELGDIQEGGDWVGLPATVTLAISDDPCDAPEALLVIKAAPYPDGSGTFLYLVLGELGLPGSPSVAELTEISNALRI